MSIKLDGPIPGQSLTQELGNSPWEQPPLYAHPEKALAWHLDKLNKGSHMEDLLFLMDQGFPISTFVDSLTTKAVMEGYHTIDVSQLISPVIHTYIKEAAQAAGVSYKEWDGPSEEEQKAERYKSQLAIKLSGGMPKTNNSLPTDKSQAFVPPMAVNTEGPSIPQEVVDNKKAPAPVESLGPNMGYVQRRQ